MLIPENAEVLGMNSRFIRVVIVALTLALGIAAGRAQATWLTDYDVAVSQASKEGKLVLIDFTGSDWCGWCMKLKEEVFDTREFAAFAQANLVLLEIDFPRRKAQAEQLRAHNAVLQNKYRVEGFPTVILANPDGQPRARLGYEPGGPSAFISVLKKLPGYAWKDAPPVPGAPVVPAKKSPPQPDEPLWGGVAFPQKRYEELKLTGLSGPAARRLAIINNQTFGPGETARVKLKDREVKLLCKEIRDKSVIVQIEGAAETKELFLP